MIDKSILLESVRCLLNSARSRGALQGVKVYEIAINEIEHANSEKELDDIWHRVNLALAGMEAYGEFTDSEYKIVCKIRELEILV